MSLESIGGRKTYTGPAVREQKHGAIVASYGSRKEIEYRFSYDDLPDADDGNSMLIEVPANSYVESALLKVGTAWVGGTNLVVGLEQTDGTVIDADGLHAAIVTANLTANSIHVGGGALVGASSGANDAIVSVVTTGTYTAGDARLVVTFAELP